MHVRVTMEDSISAVVTQHGIELRLGELSVALSPWAGARLRRELIGALGELAASYTPRQAPLELT